MTPKLKILKNIPTEKILFGMFIYTCLILVPTFIAREMKEKTFIVNNQTKNLYSVGIRKFEYQTIFLYSVFITNIFRDFVPAILDIIGIITLLIVTINHYKKTNEFRSGNSKTKAIIEQKRNLNNTKLSLIIGIISALLHGLDYSILVLLTTQPPDFFWTIGPIQILLYDIRHMLSIFLLLKFNSKFRKHFKEMFSR